MGGDLAVVKHGTHLLMPRGVHLLDIRTENINSPVRVILLWRQLLRNLLPGSLHLRKQNLSLLLRSLDFLLVRNLVLRNFPVNVKGSLGNPENLFTEYVDKTSHTHEILGSQVSSPHHILRAIHGIFYLIKKRITHNNGYVSLQTEGYGKTDHNRERKPKEIRPDRFQFFPSLPPGQNHQGKKKRDADGKISGSRHGKNHIRGGHAKEHQLLPEIPEPAALCQLTQKQYGRRTFHNGKIGGRDGHGMENVRISGISEGHIGPVQQGISGGRKELEYHASRHIHKDPLPVLPQAAGQVKQGEGNHKRHTPPSSVPENNNQRKKQSQEPRKKGWLRKPSSAKTDDGTNQDKAQKNCDPHRIFQNLHMKLVHLRCQIRPVIIVSIEACRHKISPVIDGKNLSRLKHGDHRKGKPEHLPALRHAVMNVVQTAHIFTARRNGSRNTD